MGPYASRRVVMSKGKLKLYEQELVELLQKNGATVDVGMKSISIALPGIFLLGAVDGLCNHFKYRRGS